MSGAFCSTGSAPNAPCRAICLINYVFCLSVLFALLAFLLCIVLHMFVYLVLLAGVVLVVACCLRVGVAVVAVAVAVVLFAYLIRWCYIVFLIMYRYYVSIV